MKAILFACAIALVSCGGENNDAEKKTEGSEQVQEPVLNSGPETETQRATDAVKDSAITNDSSSHSH